MNSNRLAIQPLTFVLVLGWSQLLMAPSCSENKEDVCASAQAQTVTYAVSGDCGPQGEIRVTAENRSCDFVLEGVTGLPRKGSRMNAPNVDMRNGKWLLWEQRNGEHIRCDGTEAEAGKFDISCAAEGRFRCVAKLSEK